MSSESIIDPTKPSAGRIYDYLLGGHHNFAVDRQAAEQLIKRMPYISKGARLQRWCLQDLAVEMAERRGFQVIIDFASGLPTNDHIHHVVPPGTTVIYSDYDPVVVEYARQILADTPDVHFFQADARRPDELLNRPVVQQILGERRDVALIYWGISAFLTQEDLAYVAQTLYDWSGPTSCLAFQAQSADLDPTDPNVARTMQSYAEMGSPLHIHSLAEVERLLQPWHTDASGFVDLLSWHGLGRNVMSDEDRRAVGEAGGSYGAYLVK